MACEIHKMASAIGASTHAYQTVLDGPACLALAIFAALPTAPSGPQVCLSLDKREHEKQEKPGTKTILGPGNYATMSKKEHNAKRNP